MRISDWSSDVCSSDLLILALVALMVSGCGIVYRQPIYQGNLLEKSAIDQLQPGMSKQQVIGLLGSPSIADPIHNQRWDYTATQRTGRTGHNRSEEHTTERQERRRN